MPKTSQAVRLPGPAMGQTSSQPVEDPGDGHTDKVNNNLDMPTGPEESQTVEAHANGEQDLAMEPAPKSKKSKKPKRARIVDPEQHSKEEESARTLLEMKGAHDLERTYSNEDDRAASSQILSETLVQASPDLPDNLSNGPALETLKPRKARKEKKSKRSEKRKAVEADAAELALMLVEDEPDITHDGLIPSTHAYPDPHVHDYQYQPAASIDSGFGLQHAPVASLSANGCYISTDGHAGSNYNTAGELLGYGPHNAKFAAVRSPVRTYASRPENARRRFKPSNSYMASSPPVTAASLAVAANAANALIDPALTTQDDDIWAVPDSQANGTLGDRSEDFIGTSSSTKQPAKRKRRLPDVSGSQTDSTQPTKRTKLSNDKKSTPKETAQGNASAGKNSSKLGPFDDSEITLLTDFMEEYREYHDLSEHQLNEKVQMTGRGTGPRDGFWDEVCDVLPYRTRQSIMKVCRRRFHNYGKRGKWTADDDEMLEQAQKEKPNKWKEIGEMIGRLPEDCRDRWRNYLTCGDKRKTDVWTEQEVAMLKKAVAECMDNMRKAKAQEAKGNPIKEGYASFKVKDGKSDVDLINWSVVSDMMGNCRSRLQCLYKWKKLKQNEEQELEKKKKEAEEKEEPSDLDTNQPAKAAKVSWRIRRAQQNYDKMLPGDKMEILRALSESSTYEEKNIPWRLLSQQQWHSQWSTMDRKEAFTQMKSWIPGHERFPLQTIVKMLIEIIAELEPDHLNDFYVPPEPTPEPMPANSKKRSQTQLSRTYIDGDDDTTAFDDSLLNSSHVSTNSQRRRYPQTADTSPVDENMAQQVQLLKQA